MYYHVNVMEDRQSCAEWSNIGALIITYTILGSYYKYSIVGPVGPKTLFQLLRPLYWSA